MPDDIHSVAELCLTWLGRVLTRQALELEADRRTRHVAPVPMQASCFSAQSDVGRAEDVLVSATVAAERAQHVIDHRRLQAVIDGMITAITRADDAMTSLHRPSQ